MNERELIRDLVKAYAEFALSSDKARSDAFNWGRLNALDASARPPIILDQLPWHEFSGSDELRCVSSDPLLRGEDSLKKLKKRIITAHLRPFRYTRGIRT